MPITDLPGSGSGLRRDELDPDKIKANLKTKRIGRKILVYNHTLSTQAIAAEYAKSKGNDGLVIFAEEQTAGRGRADNKWYSSRSDSILCSIVLTFNKLNAELLSLTCAVAVTEAIGSSAKGQAKIKWPNDIMLNGKKVAGILIKDNHLAQLGRNFQPKLRKIICEARKVKGAKFIAVEVDHVDDQLNYVLEIPGIDIVLLDNMGQWQLKHAVDMRNKMCGKNKKPLLEASGNITLDSVSAIAQCGIDRIAVGAITHSARAVDIGLDR